MKLLDMAIKEMRQSTRSLTAIMFMFVVPILVTALFAFMFGGVGEGESFTLPQTTVMLVNLDEGKLPANANANPDITGLPDFDMTEVGSMGELLARILQGDAFADLLTVTMREDAAAARTAVDNQAAHVALIIPPNFTDSLMLPDETAAIELYHDPTLILGPAIVASLMRQFTDSFAFTKIGTNVAITQLAEAGIPVDEALVQGVVNELTAAAFAQAQTEQTLVTIEAPPGTSGEENLLAEILGQIMGGMMIFFAFFTGAGTLQTILVEEEKGTLSRLFTTPTPVAVILGGKVLGTLIMLVVQVTVLMVLGRLVFGIQWGSLGMVVVAAAGLILIAAATGLFLASLVRNTRQSGAIYGGVLTLTGMIGMISIFTGGAVSPTIEAITLLVPQGWAVRGLQTAMQGGSSADLLPTMAGLLVWIVIFVAIAQYRLQRRFA